MKRRLVWISIAAILASSCSSANDLPMRNSTAVSTPSGQTTSAPPPSPSTVDGGGQVERADPGSAIAHEGSPGGRDGAAVPLPPGAISVEEAAAVFRYPPILAFRRPPSATGRQVAFVLASGGPNDPSSVATVWQRESHTHPYGAMAEVDRGGFLLEVVAHPTSTDLNLAPADDDKFVTVRGHEARLKETYRHLSPDEARPWRSKGRRDLRMVHWFVRQADGSIVAWQLFNNPRVHPEDETLHIVDDMVEVWP